MPHGRVRQPGLAQVAHDHGRTRHACRRTEGGDRQPAPVTFPAAQSRPGPQNRPCVSAPRDLFGNCGLVAELTAYRTLALREALANDPDMAFVAVLHALCL